MTAFAEVAINGPSGRTFTYLVPDELQSKLFLYQRVKIPLRAKNAVGFVVSFPEKSDFPKLKEISGLYDPFPVITPELFKLAEWVSKEYAASLGLTLHAMFPDKLKYFPTRKKEWLPEAKALSTGAGKFSVETVEAPLADRIDFYLQEAGKIIKEGRSVLLIVSEAARIEYFAEKAEDLGFETLSYSPKLSHGKAFDALSKMLTGGSKIIVSTRQAVFLPVKNLGAIIIEEENASSYFSDETPRFSAVETAIERGRLEGLKILLGSYSLSLNARKLHKNVISKPLDLSRIKVLDFYDKNKVVSYKIDNAVKEELKNGGRAVIMATRKGFSTSLRCKECDEVFTCKKCGVALSLYKKDYKLRCKYCGKTEDVPEKCPKCNGLLLTAAGLGIEKIEQELKKTMKYVPMERVDSEILVKESEKKAALKRFVDGKTELIAGTQLALPYIRNMEKGVVALLGVDYVLNLPSFDSGEKALELVLSLLDNSAPGVMVFVQFMKPDNRLAQALMSKKIEQMKEDELKVREELNYPPFCHLGEIIVSGATEEEATTRAEAFLASLNKTGITGIDILGPIPSNSPNMKGKAVQLLLKSKTGVSEAIRAAVIDLETKFSSVRKVIDVTIR